MASERLNAAIAEMAKQDITFANCDSTWQKRVMTAVLAAADTRPAPATDIDDLLKKAVAAFKALSPEQQAEMLEEQRQSWVRGNVGLSRDERDMTSPMMRALKIVRETNDKGRQALQAWADSKIRPAPAATDTGLVTVATYDRKGGFWTVGGYPKIENFYPDGLARMVDRSQAEELLAAERADLDRALADYRRCLVRITELQADNAAKDARIKELETERTMIVSHATLGQTDGVGLTVNDISVRVSALRNELYEEGRKQAEALGARIKETEDCYLRLCEAIGVTATNAAPIDASEKLRALEAKLGAAEKALKPFATDADIYDDQDIEDSEKSFNDNITVGDLRKARAVLGGKPS